MQPQQVTENNLYEIPNCTICLVELNEGLSSLSCGHVFHLTCIVQHFAYRYTCPNCQKRAHQKQIRPVVYPVVKNNQMAVIMRRLLSQLSLTQKQQIQKIFKQYHLSLQKNQKYQNQINEYQKEEKKLKSELNIDKINYNKIKIENESFRKDILELRKVIGYLQGEIDGLKNENLELGVKIENYKEQEYQRQKVVKYKKLMLENGETLIRYKNELQSKQTPVEQMCKSFFDLTLMKNLQVLKYKNKIKEFQQKMMEKQQQMKKISWQLEKERGENRQLKEKRQNDRKRIDQLKGKYKNVVEKYRAMKNSEDQNDDYQDSQLSRPSFPLNGQGQVKKSTGQKTLGDFTAGLRENISSLPNNGGKNNMDEETMRIQRVGSMKMSMVKIETEQNEGSQNKKKLIQSTLNPVCTKPQVLNLGSFGGIMKKKAEDRQKKPTLKNLFN